MDTYKGRRGFKTLRGARYRKGLRGQWSIALVPLRGGRLALEALTGALAAYEEVLPSTSAENPALREGTAPSTVDCLVPLSGQQPARAIWDKPAAAALPPQLHPPLPGETSSAFAPVGNLDWLSATKVVATKPRPDPLPEPGSFEPEGFETSEPACAPLAVDWRGMPTDPPADWMEPWEAELARRLAAWPVPDLACGFPKNEILAADWWAATNPTRRGLVMECIAAWRRVLASQAAAKSKAKGL